MICSGKGIFPYKLASNANEMKKIIEFPSRGFIFNDLSNEECSSTDYKFGKHIYKLFKCKNLFEFIILYNHTDTILLSEIFLVYRNIIYEHFKIDVNHFLGIPSLAYKIMMKLSKTKIELINDKKINKFFQHSIRGGCSFIKKRFAVSDYEKHDNINKNDLNFDNNSKNHIRYIDCNNLYGSCMLLDLPTKNFKFETLKKIKKIEKCLKRNKTITLPKNRGMFLQVDLLYPSNLHQEHSEFPMAIEKKIINYEDLSLFSKKIYHNSHPNKQKKFSESKLLPTFLNKNKYTLHYKNLIYYISKGLILKKIHKIVSFDQEPFLKSYIETLTKLRIMYTEKKIHFL